MAFLSSHSRAGDKRLLIHHDVKSHVWPFLSSFPPFFLLPFFRFFSFLLETGSHYVASADCELTRAHLSLSASQVLGLRVGTTVPSLLLLLKQGWLYHSLCEGGLELLLLLS